LTGAEIFGTIAACWRGYNNPSARIVRWIGDWSTGATSTVTTGAASSSAFLPHAVRNAAARTAVAQKM
jgi:hypothetical protein